ncbi:hypothetical protein ACIQPQ_34245 [Streptomyces sp. NPDC091281]|uniref:hypothetical protein n=1 Tax=Streptomyces sp. NPDC091281 TaxID=3365985 RepID=UPI00381B986A
MTIRVYTVDRHGTITADHGIRVVTKTNPPDLPLWTRVPPCECPLHRGVGTG